MSLRNSANTKLKKKRHFKWEKISDNSYLHRSMAMSV